MIASRRMRVLGMMIALMGSCWASAAAWADSDLLVAARRGDLPQVKTLLGTKVDVDARRGDGATALMAASTTGHLAVVQALLAAKADVNASMINGATSLMAAAAVGNRNSHRPTPIPAPGSRTCSR